MSKQDSPIIDVVIPARNEEGAIAKVITAIPQELVRHILVGNNGSTDQTAMLAEEHGAHVVHEPRPGYGHACLACLDLIRKQTLGSPPDIIVFLDGDYSDYPQELPMLITPIQAGADLVIGSRVTGNREAGSLQPQQRFGNWLATFLIRHLYGVHFTDLGPFRAIRWSSLESLAMSDTNYGWTVEMQVKAAKAGLACREVPVSYRSRIGQSKVSGTIKGSVLAGAKILWTIFKLWSWPSPRSSDKS